jgi:hypothetical protein
VIDREARSGSTEPVRNHDSECSTLTVLPRCSPPTVRREQAVEFHTLTKSFSTAGSARRIRPRQSRRRRGTDEAEVVPRPREFRLYLRARHLTAAVGDGRVCARRAGRGPCPRAACLACAECHTPGRRSGLEVVFACVLVFVGGEGSSARPAR